MTTTAVAAAGRPNTDTGWPRRVVLVSEPTYEQARDELADVVRRLEAGGATLEESLAFWERGEALATVCQGWLDGAKARLDAALADRKTP